MVRPSVRRVPVRYRLAGAGGVGGAAAWFLGAAALPALPALWRWRLLAPPEAADYAAMRARLGAPLASLAAATRAHDARRMATHMTEFNAAAEALLPALERDAPAKADAAALRDAIWRVRQAY